MQQTHQPLWLDQYPLTRARLRTWVMAGAALLLWPAALLGYSLYAGFGLGVFLCALVITGEVCFGVLFLLAARLQRGLYQICPACFRRRYAGYARCLCGYPER